MLSISFSEKCCLYFFSPSKVSVPFPHPAFSSSHVAVCDDFALYWNYSRVVSYRTLGLTLVQHWWPSFTNSQKAQSLKKKEIKERSSLCNKHSKYKWPTIIQAMVSMVIKGMRFGITVRDPVSKNGNFPKQGKITSPGKDVEDCNPCVLLAEMQIWMAIVERVCRFLKS